MTIRTTKRFIYLLVVALFITSCGSTAVTSDAGADFSVGVGESPGFDGCESGGEIVDYQWVIVEPPPGNEQDEGKTLRSNMLECAFTLEASMELDEVGPWVIELTVTGDDGSTASDTVTVTVTVTS